MKDIFPILGPSFLTPQEMVCTPKRQVWKIQPEPKSEAKAIGLFDFSVPFQNSGPCLASPDSTFGPVGRLALQQRRKEAAAGKLRESGFAKKKATVPVEKTNPGEPGW